MDTKDFEYLVEIARQESLSKAAARLYLSQPTLTKFLKKSRLSTAHRCLTGWARRWFSPRPGAAASKNPSRSLR